MVSVILAALLASNASGKTLVRRQQHGTVIPAAGYQGPVIPDDAGTVAHLTWTGSQLVDLKGTVAWTMQGTVPQITKSGRTPPGAGAFSDTNYYVGPTNDALDFTGDYNCHAIAYANSIANTPVVVGNSNGTPNTGWLLQFNTGFVASLWSNTTMTSTVTTTAAGRISAISWGRASGSHYVKMNLGTTASAVAAITAATSNAVKVGRWELTGLALNGAIYEIMCSSVAFSESVAVGVQQRIKNRLGITAW